MTITQKSLKEHTIYENGLLIRKKNLKILGSITDGGYLVGYILGIKYRVHHLIWLYHYGYLPKELDHINGIRNDNRIENLREVNRQENLRNTKRSKNNTSGVLGVSYFKRTKCWTAYIKVDYKKIHLGYFKDKEDAILARKKAEVEYDFHKNHGRD